jgi:hypothetical protein
MTRAQANERLTLWKIGAIVLTQAEVAHCLYLTGDID